MSALLARVSRAGPILWDVGLTSRMFVQQRGGLIRRRRRFRASASARTSRSPLAGWGAWQDPRQLGIYAGGEAQLLQAGAAPPQPGEPVPQPDLLRRRWSGKAASSSTSARCARHRAVSDFVFAGPSRRAGRFRFGYTLLLRATAAASQHTASPELPPPRVLKRLVLTPALAREREGRSEPGSRCVRIVVAPTSSHQASKRARGTPRKRRSSSDSASGTVSTSVASFR